MRGCILKKAVRILINGFSQRGIIFINQQHHLVIGTGIEQIFKEASQFCTAAVKTHPLLPGLILQFLNKLRHELPYAYA